jgi:hypothetical protein
MKRISKLRFIPRTLTYLKGSEGGEQVVNCTGLKYGDTLLVNNLEAFQYGINKYQAYQVIVCESDGVVGCEPDNWVSLRKHGDMIFFIPAFSLRKANKDPDYYFPPVYMDKFGSILFTRELYKKILRFSPKLPECDKIKEITSEEIVDVFYFEMFASILDDPFPSKRRLRNTEVEFTNIGKDSIIGDEADAIRKCKSFELQEICSDDQVVEVFLTAHKRNRYKAAVLSGNNVHLRIGNFKIVRK